MGVVASLCYRFFWRKALEIKDKIAERDEADLPDDNNGEADAVINDDRRKIQ